VFLDDCIDIFSLSSFAGVTKNLDCLSGVTMFLGG